MSSEQADLPFGDEPHQPGPWPQILREAVADPNRTLECLPLAEQAVRACPDDGHVLLLAATAALIDRKPERALTFLKRFAKRFVTIGACHLLRALAIAQEGRHAPARSLLEAHGLTDRFSAMQNFPAGWTRREWLFREHDAIVGRSRDSRRKTAVKRRSAPRATPSKPSGPPPVRPSAHEPPPVPPAPPGLPLIDIDIPISATINLAPLLDALAQAPSADGAWHDLRERHAISAWRRASTSCSACRICAASKRSGTRSRPCARC